MAYLKMDNSTFTFQLENILHLYDQNTIKYLKIHMKNIHDTFCRNLTTQIIEGHK